MLGIEFREQHFLGALSLKTNRLIFGLIMTAGLVLLWATPIITSKEFDTGQFAIDFVIFMGAYLMLVCPDLFSSGARRKKQPISRVPT